MSHLEYEVLVILQAPRIHEKETKEQYRGRVIKSAQSFAKYQKADVLDIFPIIAKKTSKSIIRLKRIDINLDEWMRNLMELPNVISVEKNIITTQEYYPSINNTPIETNDPLYSFQEWYMNMIDAPLAWNLSTGNSNFVVAVADSGIYYDHEDLKDNMCIDLDGNRGFNATDVNNPTDIIDRQGHGTNMTGVIGAKSDNNKGITGINWNIKLLPVKVLNDEGNGTLSGIISGLNYIMDQKDRGLNIKIVNMSLGGWSSKLVFHQNHSYCITFNALKDQDILVVVASGNEFQDIDNPGGTGSDPNNPTISYVGRIPTPAAFSMLCNNVITVSAIDQYYEKPNFANHSENFVSIMAPGVNVATTHLRTDDQDRYVYSSGTSIATAIVSGIAALVWALYPTESYAQIKQRLLKFSTPHNNIKEYIFHQSGIVNTLSAMENNPYYQFKYLLSINNKPNYWNGSNFTTLDYNFYESIFTNHGIENIDTIFNNIINEDVKIMSYSNVEESVRLNLEIIPRSVRIEMENILLSTVDSINNFTLYGDVENNAIVKICVSVNDGYDWFSYINDNWIHCNNIKLNGNTISEFNNINTAFNNLIESIQNKYRKIKLAFYFELFSNSDDINIDKLEYNINMNRKWLHVDKINRDIIFDNDSLSVKLFEEGIYKINY